MDYAGRAKRAGNVYGNSVSEGYSSGQSFKSPRLTPTSGWYKELYRKR